MNYEEQNNSSRSYNKIKATLHIGMGIVYILLGSLVLYIKAFGAMELPTGFAYVLGGLMVLYGLFRLWRGWMDMKIKNGRRPLS